MKTSYSPLVSLARLLNFASNGLGVASEVGLQVALHGPGAGRSS